jgi:hypothetical protein
MSTIVVYATNEVISMLDFLTKYEPVWLFLILFAELGISMRNWRVLEKEYEYDKWFNEEYIIPKKRFREKKAAMKAKQVETTPPTPPVASV